YAQVPLLLDYTSTVLTWEYMNIEFVRAHGFGDVITSLHRLTCHVNSLLKSAEKMHNMRMAMQSFTLPDVERNVRTLVDDMMESISVPKESEISFEKLT